VNSDLRNLIALQEIDQKIASLQKKIVDVPAQIQILQDELKLLTKNHQDKIANSQELAKRRRVAEGEVDLMRTKLSRLKDQLMTVKTNKEYTAMLHEIQMAETQIRQEEDKILEIMEGMETSEQELKAYENALSAHSRQVEQSIRELEGSIPVMERESITLHEEKTRMEDCVAGELLSRYHQIARARRGIALAEAREELCSVCHVRIRPQVYAELLRADVIYVCDSCDRILFLREALQPPS
jgi:predicted  nucleic acid-binding Zn-ribbon protein